MLRTPLLGALLACCAASASLAQAPRVTSAGDPSIESDTIYRLVVDPKDHPEDDMVLLLDDGIVRVEPDGRTTQTYHQVVQILTEAGAREFQERSYSWAPDREKFHLNWFRVVRPDGTVISDGPTQSQEGDVPVAMGDPVYSQRKRLRISMSGIAAGVLVDYSTTREDTRAWIPGDFLTSWSIHTGSFTRRSRYILDVPAGMPLHLKEHNLTFTPRHETVRGREVTTWAAQDLPLVKPESFATDTGPKLMSFEISGPVTWERIGTWYAGLARDRYVVTPAVMAPLTAALAAAHDLRDTVRAVHRYVAQDIRYVSIDLGIGGYQPRTPDEVVRTGFGDCKDKATLFVAVLRHLGIPASTVLLSSTASADSALPAIEQFDHAIARVDLPDGPVYTDLTARTIPFGEIPISIEGGFGLLVPPTGPVRRVTFPVIPIADQMSVTELHGVIDTAGRITGELTVRRMGEPGAGMRDSYWDPIDSTTRANAARRIAQNMFDEAHGDSLHTPDGKDLLTVPEVHLWFSGGRALQPSGHGWILPNPLGTMAAEARSAETLEKEVERDTIRWAPIDVEGATGNTSFVLSVAMQLPHGWHADVPRSVHLDNEFGVYSADYAQNGDVFTATRRFIGHTGALPPSRLPDLIAYFRAIAADNTPYIAITPAP